MWTEVERNRAARLARGNALLKRGLFAGRKEWRIRREEHPERLRRIDEWLETNGKQGRRV